MVLGILSQRQASENAKEEIEKRKRGVEARVWLPLRSKSAGERDSRRIGIVATVGHLDSPVVTSAVARSREVLRVARSDKTVSSGGGSVRKLYGHVRR